LNSIQDALLVYELKGLEVELFLMGRPWLTMDEFNTNYKNLTQLFNELIEKEIYG
jgi:hypothetical protein